jgi:hypothetical protein
MLPAPPSLAIHGFSTGEAMALVPQSKIDAIPSGAIGKTAEY